MNKIAARSTDIPEGRHWAIVSFRSITIPGDERSRTAPGHGYPESTEDVSNYQIFLNEPAWRAAIERLTTQQPGSFAALIVDRLRVTTRVIVEIGG